MALQVLWERDCPGYIETELVSGSIRVTCYVEEPVEPDNRVTAGLRVLYTFEEGQGTTILDVSGVGTPMNLLLERADAVAWLPGGGLAVKSPTVISSIGPATKLIQAARASNQLTAEAWIKPANITQDGPARIITVSNDFLYRNLQLGQAGELYDVRVRTTVTTENGDPSLLTPYGALTTNLTHLVYTRATSGADTVYVNGNKVAARVVGGNLSNWDENLRFVLANEVIGSRAWLGEYHLIAFYDRALTQDEVGQNYRAGPHTK